MSEATDQSISSSDPSELLYEAGQYLEKAKQCLIQININSLCEIASYSNLPDPIQELLKAIWYITGNFDDYNYNNARYLLYKENVELLIKNSENFRLSIDIKEKVIPIMYEQGINYQSLALFSRAAWEMYQWADYIIKYDESLEKAQKMLVSS